MALRKARVLVAAGAKLDVVAASYGKPVIFLFLGGFLLALGLQRSGVHRRIALWIVDCFGSRPSRLILGFMVATALLSMWISNTATVVMMIPIATSLIALLPANHSTSTKTDDARRFELCLLLGIAYSASIGGLGNAQS